MVEPRLRGQETGRDEWDARLQPEPFCCAGPRPVLNLLYQARRQGAPFDHRAAPDQCTGCGQGGHDHRDTGDLDQRCVWIATGIPYPFEQRFEPLRSRRLDDEVPDLGEQRERQQPRAMPGQDFRESPEQRPVVGRSLQMGVWVDEAAGEVNVANSGRVGHCGYPPGPVQRQARCQPECHWAREGFFE
jgi:hypothetical protein